MSDPCPISLRQKTLLQIKTRRSASGPIKQLSSQLRQRNVHERARFHGEDEHELSTKKRTPFEKRADGLYTVAGPLLMREVDELRWRERERGIKPAHTSDTSPYLPLPVLPVARLLVFAPFLTYLTPLRSPLLLLLSSLFCLTFNCYFLSSSFSLSLRGIFHLFFLLAISE